MHWRWIGGGGSRPRAVDAAAALSIAAADLTMAVFFSRLSANAYSYSRVLALLVSAIIAAVALRQPLSGRFLAGAGTVAASGWVYREPERAAAAAAALLSRVSPRRARIRRGGWELAPADDEEGKAALLHPPGELSYSQRLET